MCCHDLVRKISFLRRLSSYSYVLQRYLRTHLTSIYRFVHLFAFNKKQNQNAPLPPNGTFLYDRDVCRVYVYVSVRNSTETEINKLRRLKDSNTTSWSRSDNKYRIGATHALTHSHTHTEKKNISQVISRIWTANSMCIFSWLLCVCVRAVCGCVRVIRRSLSMPFHAFYYFIGIVSCLHISLLSRTAHTQHSAHTHKMNKKFFFFLFLLRTAASFRFDFVFHFDQNDLSR